jgi:hypothetical protein
MSERPVGITARDSSAEAGRAERRRFLKQISAGAVAALGTPGALSSAKAFTPLPTIALGPHRLTRLIAGSNPISGYSHSTRNLAEHMKEYFSHDRIVGLIERCEKAGINAWQTGHGPDEKVVAALRALRERGSKIHWLCLGWQGGGHRPLKEVVDLGPIAVVHHGGVTDRLFRKNQADKVHDFIKKAHDLGVLAGVSSHNPDNIAYVEDKAWENDFFMTCFYNVSRPAEEIRERFGTTIVGEPFLESDRDLMSAVVRQVKRPCLAFKILAAGRLCWNDESVESAFQYALSHIKSTDAVILGMYPRFSDEVARNVELTLKYAGASVA